MGYRNAKSGRENIFEETVDKGILHEDINYVVLEGYILLHRTPVAYREGGFGVFRPPPPRNSEDIGGVLNRTSKKNRRFDFLLQFTVFS